MPLIQLLVEYGGTKFIIKDDLSSLSRSRRTKKQLGTKFPKDHDPRSGTTPVVPITIETHLKSGSDSDIRYLPITHAPNFPKHLDFPWRVHPPSMSVSQKGCRSSNPNPNPWRRSIRCLRYRPVVKVHSADSAGELTGPISDIPCLRLSRCG